MLKIGETKIMLMPRTANKIMLITLLLWVTNYLWVCISFDDMPSSLGHIFHDDSLSRALSRRVLC